MVEDNIYKILKEKLHQHFHPKDDHQKSKKLEYKLLQQQYDTLSQEYKTIYKDVIRLLPILRKDKDLATEYLRFLLWMGHYNQHMSPILLPAFLFVNTSHQKGSTVPFEDYKFIKSNYNILKSVVEDLVPDIIHIGQSNSCKIPSNLQNFHFGNKGNVETLLWQNLGELFNYYKYKSHLSIVFLFNLFVEIFATSSIEKEIMFQEIRELLQKAKKQIQLYETEKSPHIFFPLTCIISKSTHHKKIEIEDSWSRSILFVLLFLFL